MDNLLLEAIVSELRPRLVGWPVFAVAAAGSETFLLVFDDPLRSRLLVSVQPALSRIHLTKERGARKGTAASPFTAIASHHLHGAVLAAIEKEPSDRIVRLRFAGPEGPGKSLIAELLGRSSNLLLLDREERILGFARRMRSQFRSPAVGKSYEPPRPLAAGGSLTRRPEAAGPDASGQEGPSREAGATVPKMRRPREDGPQGESRETPEHGPREQEPSSPDGAFVSDPRALSAGDLERAAARALRESHPLADLLLGICPALGPLAAREIEHRSLAGEPPFRVLEEWLDRAFGMERSEGLLAGDRESFRAVRDPSEELLETERRHPGPGGFLYAERPPEELDRRRSPAPGRFLLSPMPLTSASPGLTAHEYATINDAADVYFRALGAGIAFRSRRDALLALARREARRAEEIAAKVAGDLETMQEAGRYRLYGEALLAGLTRAERQGDVAIVPDPYDAAGGTLVVPVDPAATLQVNAQRYFHRHRKAERGRTVAGARLEAQTRRCEAMMVLAGRIAEAAAEEDLEAVEEALRGQGIGVGLERRRRGEAASSAPKDAGVRIYRSREGYEILVGKGAKENEELTFRIAGPEDFWLHASGASGAHVVVRNPRLLARLPETTLQEAAQLAAFYSKAKGAGRVEVAVTRRKYVRRPRGAPRGTVTLKKHQSVAVSPRHPFEG